MNKNIPQTLILVGRTGNGKSATGNSILGKSAFLSMTSASGVTTKIEMGSTKRENGHVVQVIDTPGLFDVELKHDIVCKEIVKSMDLAKSGIHALLLVYSARKRFSSEEAAAIHVMKDIFGPTVTKYMIVVMTGVDELEDGTHEHFLSHSPKSFQNILDECSNRHVFFDNKTRDEAKKRQQVQKLHEVVDIVIRQNQGIPFTNSLMHEIKVATKAEYAQVIEQTTKTISNRLRDSIQRLEQQLREQIKLTEKAESDQQQQAVRIHELEEKVKSLKKERKRAELVHVAGDLLQILGICGIM